MSILDGQIASVARTDHLAIATGNVRNFEHGGLQVIDPFSRG